MQVMVPEDLREHMVPTSSLVPYVGNAKRHPDWQVEQIARSIEAFGFSDPIAVWHDIAGHPIIVEGHGRLLAAKLLGLEEVPVITLDHLDDEGRRAYTLAHNKLTMNTEFDLQLLDSELDAIEGLDMGEFGFEAEEPEVPQQGTGKEVEFSDTLGVFVTVRDEQEQEAVYTELVEGGYSCRLLTL